MGESIIKVEGLGKKYIISHEGKESYTALRDVIAKKTNKIFRKRQATVKEEFWALNNLSFEIGRGEAVGIIGRNGAGKSTLLKILSRITEPTTGRIEINGRVASLLEVGTGFHPELTGRENIFLNGAILGMSRQEIKRKFDEIVSFSGVEKFLDTPVKRYSSGMYVRLAFAVAAHLEPEILVVDEVLAVGDAEFQRKCLGKMNEVSRNEGRTVLFVSHDINAIAQLCNKSILLKNGSVDLYDDTQTVVSRYLSAQKTGQGFASSAIKDKPVSFTGIQLTSPEGQPQAEFIYTEPVTFLFDLNITQDHTKCNVFILVLDSKKRRVFACESSSINAQMKLTIEGGMLVRGDYSVNAYINIPNVGHIDSVEDICHFTIIDNGSTMSKHGNWDYGMVLAKYHWEE